MRDALLEAGKIVTTRGVAGELKLHPWCDGAQFLMQFDELYVGEGREKYRVLSCREFKGCALIRLDGVDSVEKAMPLVGAVVYFDRKDAKLPPGAFFVRDLIGLKVTDADDGHVYGVVTDVFQTGANDVYEVAMEDGSEALIPAIKDVVISIDAQEGRISIRPIKGLFSDED